MTIVEINYNFHDCHFFSLNSEYGERIRITRYLRYEY